MSHTPREEDNRELVRGAYTHVLMPLDSSRVDDFFAPDYIQHSPLARSGAAGLKAFLDWARANTPHAEHRIQRMFVDDDHVIVHVHVIIDPGERGNAVIDVFRIRAGRIVEHWDVAQPVPAQSANSNGMF